jgi:hypothetical protein
LQIAPDKSVAESGSSNAIKRLDFFAWRVKYLPKSIDTESVDAYHCVTVSLYVPSTRAAKQPRVRTFVPEIGLPETEGAN